MGDEIAAIDGISRKLADLDVGEDRHRRGEPVGSGDVRRCKEWLLWQKRDYRLGGGVHKSVKLKV